MSLSLKVTILICIFLPEGQGTLLLRAQGRSAFSFLFHYLLTEAFQGPASQACYGGRNGTWLHSRYLWDVTEGRTGGRTGQRGESQQGWVPPRSLPFLRPAPDPSAPFLSTSTQRRERRAQLHSSALDVLTLEVPLPPPPLCFTQSLVDRSDTVRDALSDLNVCRGQICRGSRPISTDRPMEDLAPSGKEVQGHPAMLRTSQVEMTRFRSSQ